MQIKHLLFAFALLVPTITSADDKGATKPAPADKAKLGDAETKIIAHLHHVNVMEVDMGKLAQKNSTTAGVKKYGAMLVKDHSGADKDLAALAKKKGLAKLPDVEAKTDAEKADMKAKMEAMANLEKLKGPDFDREYLKMMVEGHDKELADTDGHIAASSDADLDAALEKRKTTLQKHSDEAKKLQTAPATSKK
jgi:putative membrane protein